MLFHSVITTNSWCAQIQRRRLPALLHYFPIPARAFTASASLPEASGCTDDCCSDFLPWLRHKSGAEISTALSIGTSSCGRALYAAEDVRIGDCLLKVPFSVQLAPDNLPPEISCSLGDTVGNVAKAALLILYEQKLGQNSEWAPYISRLPRPEDLHSTIFWSCDELKMIQPSFLYEETLRQKRQIEKNYWAIKLVFDRFPDYFRDVSLEGFMYACGLVTSRAWESSRGVSMIPFADFLNHDTTSESYVLSDEGKRHSEVIADRDYAPGDQVMIRYGRFSNATLLLDFGFTVSYNIYDQVALELNIPEDDGLYTLKMELLDRYQLPSIKDNDFISSGNSFTIKEVRTGSRKGKGIPQSLRGFSRILTSTSKRELDALGMDAAKNDGRLARYPLKDKVREIEAHQFLLSKISQLIEEHNSYTKLFGDSSSHLCKKAVVRRRLAQDLLIGELRVLQSASAWLRNYCSTMQMG